MSLDDIEETCDGQASNLAALEAMVKEENEGEIRDLRRDIRGNTAVIAGCKEANAVQQMTIDDVEARLAALRAILDGITEQLDDCLA